MFWNYLKIALRNLRKNKLFSLINILGLAIGLTIYLFANLMVEYEGSYDSFFENSERIYTVGSIPGANLELPFEQINTTYSRVGPILISELSDIEAVARILPENMLLTVGSERRYQDVVFSDPELLRIFDFRYIHGNSDALDSPSAILINASIAMEMFGSTNVIGKTITLDNSLDLRVAAVIEDSPKNSHFSGRGLEIFTSMAALEVLRGIDPEGDWNNLLLKNLTYVLLPEHLEQSWLTSQLDSAYQRHFSERSRSVVSGLVSIPIGKAGLSPIGFGISLNVAVPVLALLILIIACVNYSNLAIAQSLRRSREIGMRKTMGASQGQLISQFLLESILVAALAACVALAAMELLIPLFNATNNSALTFDYAKTLPWLICATIAVGLVAGGYPAWLIARVNTIDALRDIARKGNKALTVRAIMIGAQFAISTFMLAAVVVIYFQNNKIENASYIFPRSEIYVIEDLHADGEQVDIERLKREIEALPSVKSIAFSSQTPFIQLHPTRTALTEQGNEASVIKINRLGISPEFLETYGIPLVAGRNLDSNIANDSIRVGSSGTANILINEMAVSALGVANPEDAISRRIYIGDSDRRPVSEFVVVGVVADRNIIGLTAAEMAWMFVIPPDQNYASVRFHTGTDKEMVKSIQSTWDNVVPSKPIQGRFLDETFDENFRTFQIINLVLAGLAFVALSLAMIGLFGLTVFIAMQKTKEIGIRKVLGASSAQISTLLIWQFSKPVVWALAIALPLAFLATDQYLQFFSDRIGSPILLLLFAGLLSVALGWMTVAGQAYRVARANPITALRQE